MFKLLSISATCLALATSLSAWGAPADRFAEVVITAQHVDGTVHMLQGAGGNIGVSVGADGTLIIDDQYAPLADRIIAALKDLGGDRPKLILNTHYHGDHAGSNPQMGTTGTIISHDNVRVRLLGQDDFARTGLPLVTFDDELKVHFNGEEIQLIHLPSGHTDGDSVVWFKSANVIHMGDHFFNGFYPYIDIGSGGSVDGFIANVERVLGMIPDDIKVIPGHGALSDKAGLADAVRVIKASSSTVRSALAAGTSAEDIAAQLDADYPSWGKGFISASSWIQILQADANR